MQTVILPATESGLPSIEVPLNMMPTDKVPLLLVSFRAGNGTYTEAHERYLIRSVKEYRETFPKWKRHSSVENNLKRDGGILVNRSGGWYPAYVDSVKVHRVLS